MAKVPFATLERRCYDPFTNMISLAFINNIFGPQGWIIVLILVLLFGAKKLPELAKGLGEGIKSFKEAVKEEENKPSTPPPAATTAEHTKQE